MYFLKGKCTSLHPRLKETVLLKQCYSLNVQDGSGISHNSSSQTCPVHLIALNTLSVPEPPHLWITKEHLLKRKVTSLLISKCGGQQQFRPLFRSWLARQGPFTGLVGSLLALRVTGPNCHSPCMSGAHIHSLLMHLLSPPGLSEPRLPELGSN